MTTGYAEFLAAKTVGVGDIGHEVSVTDVHPYLHDWQRDIVAWAVGKGRAAIWADTGLGKTLMQIEWARLSGETTLIVAPLAVCQQTVREAAKVGIQATYSRDGIDGPGLYVTNYEMVDRFDPDALDAVVLDEASILKNSDGKMRRTLTEHFASVKRRLACTATPAPNDSEELTGQAAFLGVSTRANMLAAYFVHDDSGWRVKGHARRPMFRWMASWAVALRRPSDLGYPDDGYDLPGLEIIPHFLDVDVTPEGQLFATDLGGVGGRAAVRRQTLAARCERAAELVNQSHGLAAGGAKLAAWDGSPNTPKQGAPNTKPTPTNANAAKVNPEHLTPTANTCGATTEPIPRSSVGHPSNNPSSTDADANGTPLTPSSESFSSRERGPVTPPSSATVGSDDSSASVQPSSTTSSPTRAAAARSATRLSETAQDDGTTSTTATQQGKCEESSAANATSGLGSSTTTPTYSGQPLATSVEPWIVWVGLNDEQTYLERSFGDRCFSLKGNQTPEQKVDILYRWIDGERPILVTKTSIAGFGINMQHCARMVFVGLSDSYEAYYQAIRRCYRYGQTRPVHAHVVLSNLESQIAVNVTRKERDAATVTASLVDEMREARKAIA